MINIQRGRGIKIDGDPTIHAYGVDDGNPETVVTVNCMACLVMLPRYYRDPEEVE